MNDNKFAIFNASTAVVAVSFSKFGCSLAICTAVLILFDISISHFSFAKLEWSVSALLNAQSVQ